MADALTLPRKMVRVVDHEMIQHEANSSGFLYEMGGTWVTHHMGFLFREMVRYGMDRDLITTGSPDMHKGYYTINVPGKSTLMFVTAF